MQSQVTNTPPADVLQFCAACGYDLRHIESARCPECGADVAVATATSRIPWTHRQQIGRIRAYLRTVWFATIRVRALANEMTRPAEFFAARRFGLISGVLAALPFAALFLVEYYNLGGTGVFAELLDPLNLMWSGGPITWMVEIDVYLPWVAGASLVPVLPLCMLLLGVLISGVHTYWFHPRSMSVPIQNRSVALSWYAAAPLNVLPIIAVAYGAAVLLEKYNGAFRPLPQSFLILSLLLFASVPLLLLSAQLRLLLYLTHYNWLRTLLAGIFIPLTWLVCFAFCIGIVPWIVGFVWLMIDSSR